jgi:2-(1,2-epoxy-1,2-dihydrophenyl)acetyl-CoA isomerase
LTEEILYSIKDGIFHIEFNRPNKLNAFTGDMFKKYKDLLRAADESEARVIIVSGKGRAFSAGADLMSLARLEYVETGEAVKILHDMYEATSLMLEIDKPIIAAVQGYAIGSGFGIAVASDVLIVSKDAVLRPGYIAVGLNPEFCTSLLIPLLIGYKNAFKLFVMNEDITGERAYEIGLAQYLVDKEELLDTAFDVAKKISSLPSKTVYNTKKLLRNIFHLPCREVIKMEAELQGENIQTEEHKKHIMKFLESFKK